MAAVETEEQKIKNLEIQLEKNFQILFRISRTLINAIEDSRDTVVRFLDRLASIEAAAARKDFAEASRQSFLAIVYINGTFKLMKDISEYDKTAGKWVLLARKVLAEIKVDKSKSPQLNALIGEYNELLSLLLANYEDINDFLKALNEIKAVLDEGARTGWLPAPEARIQEVSTKAIDARAREALKNRYSHLFSIVNSGAEAINDLKIKLEAAFPETRVS